MQQADPNKKRRVPQGFDEHDEHGCTVEILRQAASGIMACNGGYDI